VSDASATDEDGPGVRINPTLIAAAGMFGGIILGRWRALPLPGDLPGTAIGTVLICLAGTLAVWAFLQYQRNDTAIRPDQPNSVLITTGPYRYSRNPQYIVLALVQVTVACWLDNLWILALTPVTMIIITRYAITREERYLEQRFGQSYIDYRQRVRRWI
jgi:protein-S-isoprenylcysteine O-methyltransferase Ste14